MISKGLIIYSSKEDVELLRQPLKTIAIPVASSMVPSFEVLVYHVAGDGMVIADSVSVPINKFDIQNVSLIYFERCFYK